MSILKSNIPEKLPLTEPIIKEVLEEYVSPRGPQTNVYR